MSGAVRLAQPGQLAERGEVGEPRGAGPCRCVRGARASRHRGCLARRVGWGRRPEPSPGIVVLGGHRGDEPVEPRLAGELGVERGGDDVALADGDDPAVVEAGEDVDAGAGPLDRSGPG